MTLHTVPAQPQEELKKDLAQYAGFSLHAGVSSSYLSRASSSVISDERSGIVSSPARSCISTRLAHVSASALVSKDPVLILDPTYSDASTPGFLRALIRTLVN